MPHNNIQHLFGSISLPQIRAYLLRTGWLAKGGAQADKVQFERSVEGEQESVELWIWSSTDHAKFRGRVPHVVFTLSVLEDRPALEVANDIFSCPLLDAPAASVRPTPGDDWLASGIVSDALRRFVAATGVDLGGVERELGPVLVRIDFELDAQAPTDAGSQDAVRRQAAVLAASLARRLPATDAGRDLLWDVCSQLIEPRDLRMPFDAADVGDGASRSKGELFELALGDDELRPAKTLRWLRERTASGGG